MRMDHTPTSLSNSLDEALQTVARLPVEVLATLPVRRLTELARHLLDAARISLDEQTCNDANDDDQVPEEPGRRSSNNAVDGRFAALCHHDTPSVCTLS